MSAQVTVMVQHDSYVRVRLFDQKVTIEAVLIGPDDCSNEWLAKVHLEIKPTDKNDGPHCKSIEHVASDAQREVVATWVVQTLSRLVGRNTLL